MQQSILLFFVLIVFMSACRKGDLPAEHYFGQVSISQASTTDAGPLDVYFEGTKMATLASGGVPSTLVLPANKQGRLSIFKSSTDSLIADTAIVVPGNGIVHLKVIYSDLLGIKGFLNGDLTVGADSVKMQFFYTFNRPYNDYPSLDLHIYSLNGSQLVETGVVVAGMKKGALHPLSVTLPHVEAGSATRIRYAFKLKSPATGEFIKQQYLNRDFFLLMGPSTIYEGHLNLIQVHDNVGEDMSNQIQAAITTL